MGYRKTLFGIVVAVIVIVAGLSLMDITTIVNSQKATTNTVNVSPLRLHRISPI
jgi:hypothetical protein